MQTPVYKTDLWCRRGHFNEDQADKYAALCQEIQPSYVLEVGFCTGRSAACVLHQARTSILKMVSIDKDLDWKAPDGRQMAALLQKRFPTFEVVEQHSCNALTREFFRTRFPAGVDLVTIDGDHSYEGCRSDLNAISPFLSPRGAMVVDDYRSGPPNGVEFQSVTDSVDDFLDKHREKFHADIWNRSGKGFCIIRREM